MPSLGITEEVHEKRLLLLDASSIFYPAFHVLTDFSNSEGFPTGAIFGFTRTLLKLMREYPSHYVAVIYDARGKTVRHDRYPEYKANRAKTPDELKVQVPKIKELVEAIGLAGFEQQGLEADDLIASFAAKAKESDFEVLIATGDKDLLQLVTDKIHVLKPGRKVGEELRQMNPDEVEKYMGVPPEKVRDYLAILGDSVDNVPGVPGVGKKSAEKLLQEYESLDEILANTEKIGNTRAKNALEKNEDLARLSYDLIGLEYVDIESEWTSCVPQEPNWDRVSEMFSELGFNSFISELGLDGEAGAAEPATQVEVDVEIVRSESQLQDLCNNLASSEVISFDLETTSEDEMLAEIVGIAISLEPFSGYYIPVGHDEDSRQLELDHVLEQLKPIFTDLQKQLIGQNLKYDIKVLARVGFHIPKISFDSMLAAHLIDPGSKKSLDDLGMKYFGHGVRSFKELSEDQMNKIPIDEAADYAVCDSEVVLRLRDEMLPQLKEYEMEQIYNEIEIPTVNILADLEVKGVLVDPEILSEQEVQLEAQLVQIKEEIFTIAGEEFNIASPKQVAHILFEKLELPVVRKTKTGPSTDARVLEQLALHHPLPEKILANRELEKILNTYIRKLPDHINETTGRIHSQFNQSVAATGRLSSTNPNLQNIPIRSALGGQIREAFIAPKGKKLIGADYSQIELRVMAHITEDPMLIDAYKNDADIHSLTAATVYGLEVDEVSYEQRDVAKRINFGVSYGMGAFGLAQWAKITRKEAQQFIDSYFENYAGVKAYIDNTIQLVKDQGYVSSLFGRRRYFPKVDARAEREAINMPIQGTAADLMKLSMIKVDEQLKSAKINADMICQIHDELIVEVDEDQVDECLDIVVTAMESTMELNVPLKVEAEVGNNWGEI